MSRLLNSFAAGFALNGAIADAFAGQWGWALLLFVAAALNTLWAIARREAA